MNKKWNKEELNIVLIENTAISRIKKHFYHINNFITLSDIIPNLTIY